MRALGWTEPDYRVPYPSIRADAPNRLLWTRIAWPLGSSPCWQMNSHVVTSTRLFGTKKKGDSQQMPVCNQPIPSQIGEKHVDGENDLTGGQVCVGLLGATAMIVAGVGVRGMFSRTRRNIRRRSHLIPQERSLIRYLVSQGEKRRWDFSYDEDFLFKFVPVLKRMARLTR